MAQKKHVFPIHFILYMNNQFFAPLLLLKKTFKRRKRNEKQIETLPAVSEMSMFDTT